MSHDIQTGNPFNHKEDFIKAIEKFDTEKKLNKLDLSSDQDLSIAIMNLISIEEHFFFSGAKTKKTHYYDLLKDVREMRKTLLKQIIHDTEGEEWCICKHLLSASMRLMEVGTKQLNLENKELACEMFDKSYELYALFWGLVMKVVDTSGFKKIDEGQLDKHDKSKKTVMGALGSLVKKVIDCCIE